MPGLVAKIETDGSIALLHGVLPGLLAQASAARPGRAAAIRSSSQQIPKAKLIELALRYGTLVQSRAYDALAFPMRYPTEARRSVHSWFGIHFRNQGHS